MEKECTKCRRSKPLECFWFNEKRKSYHARCTPCKSADTKKYHNVTKEKKAQYDMRYRERHADELKKKKKLEYECNKEKYIARQLKIQQSLLGKIKHNIRTRIGNAVTRKSNSSSELLGCDIQFYLRYLSHLFEEGMSWNNYGVYWQIDHVNCLANFDLTREEQQKAAFNWKNTRPLATKENLSKKRNTSEEIELHREKVKSFLIATSSNCGNSL